MAFVIFVIMSLLFKRRSEKPKPTSYQNIRYLYDFFIKKEIAEFKLKNIPLHKVGDIVTIDRFELHHKNVNGWDSGHAHLRQCYDGKYHNEYFVGEVKSVNVISCAALEAWERYYPHDTNKNPAVIWMNFVKNCYGKGFYFGTILDIYWEVKVKPFNPKIREFSLNEFSFININSDYAKRTKEMLNLLNEKEKIKNKLKHYDKLTNMVT